MAEGVEEVRWAPRVERGVIRRLYESDARGRLDERLLAEVFFGFLARCRSILEATEAAQGRVRCPRCAELVLRRGPAREELLRCARCGWRSTWAAYHGTFRRKQLVGFGAIDAFREFVRRAPEAGTARERMLLVDWLVHQVHKGVLAGREEYWRPAAVNLIAGNTRDVAALLDDLAYGAGSTPELRDAGAHWRDAVRPRLWSARRAESTPRSPG
jgi:ribosomal protein L37AE/L43A